MPVSVFTAKVDALKAKGPFALFSSDFKLLTRLIKADGAALDAENAAAAAAGRRKAYCSPPGGLKMDQKQVLEAMAQVPAAQRPATDTRDAIRSYLARKHPC